MWTAVIVQLIEVVAPIVLKMVSDHMAANNRQVPTIEQLREKLEANSDAIIAEGDAWLASHPKGGL